MNFSEAVQYLNSFINYEKEKSFQYPEAFKLDRIRRLAKVFGNPQNAYECVLIAGSKGKGSSAAILSSILRMENLRVGLYTSPHLLDLRERIQVNGLPINEIRFTEIAMRLRRILDDVSWRRDPPTYFEVLTAMAFCHFKEMKTHVAVLEVGLGGLYDSTNIAPAKVVGMTPISLEHTDKLGKTVSKIAVQKCGIIKGREAVVSSPQAREAEAVIEKTAEEREADLWRVGKEIRVVERDYGENFQKFDLRGPFGNYYDLEIRLRGSHQIENAALAVGLAKNLGRKTRLAVSDSAVRQGLLDAAWPGRLEKISDKPKIVLDGAHNVDSMKKMMLALKRHFKFSDLVVVFGVSEDKDFKGMLAEILPQASCLVATQSASPRSLSPRVIAESAENQDREIFVEENPLQALEKAESLAAPEDLIVVTGSLFLVADVKAGLLERRI